MPAADVDPAVFSSHATRVRGLHQTYVHEGRGGVPIVLVHGWPESKRLWWRVIGPLAAAGFEVVVPDLRGFGDSDVAPDGFHDVPSHSRDLYALVHDDLGHERVTLVGGDLGGAVIQDVSLRFPGFVDRMVLFNSPLPYDPDAMSGMMTRPPTEAGDYFRRQATDAFTDEAVAFHVEPFSDHAKLRAGFRGYESVFSPSARSEPSVMASPNSTRTLVLFGPSDHVIYPDFDRMAAVVFPDHVGPFLLRDAGHFIPWEAPHALVSATVAFCGDLLALRR